MFNYIFIGVQLIYNAVSFMCTAKWISYMYTYIHFFLDSIPIWAVTGYWGEFPVLHSRSLLVLYFIYSSVYMAIPISQFIPPYISYFYYSFQKYLSDAYFKTGTMGDLNIHWKGWCWSSNTLATWCKELTHWKRPWCWETLKAKGEGGGRGWDG